MKKIALLSTASVLGFFDPNNPDAPPHELYSKGASVNDLSHFSEDYQSLTQALKKHEFTHEIVSWHNPKINWSDYAAVLIHTPWDYFEHKDAFLKKLQEIESQTLLLNSYKTVLWNIDKKYLQDAKNAGINIIDTTFVDPDTVDNILEHIPDHYWTKGCIFKPSVSAGAADVFLLKNKDQAQGIYSTHFKNKHATLMIQPFMEEIKKEGEWSFVFFNGQYSHGVLKKTMEDGFGVKHSIENQKYKPTPEMIDQATQMYDLLEASRKDNPLYTRLDTIKTADGKLYIMEIEQIEPYLYLHSRTPDAANDLVHGILSRIK